MILMIEPTKTVRILASAVGMSTFVDQNISKHQQGDLRGGDTPGGDASGSNMGIANGLQNGDVTCNNRDLNMLTHQIVGSLNWFEEEHGNTGDLTKQEGFCLFDNGLNGALD